MSVFVGFDGTGLSGCCFYASRGFPYAFFHLQILSFCSPGFPPACFSLPDTSFPLFWFPIAFIPDNRNLLLLLPVSDSLYLRLRILDISSKSFCSYLFPFTDTAFPFLRFPAACFSLPDTGFTLSRFPIAHILANRNLLPRLPVSHSLHPWQQKLTFATFGFRFPLSSPTDTRQIKKSFWT